ncbi:MAG: serine/threonine protein kinase [Bacteroidaceae bacterium]|nr:serine/threonine protein kinase [Bacteroidaceae bacterium]
MPYVKIQGREERQRGVYYQVNSDDQPIGVGGMGQVYKGICVDERTGSSRPVAIKFMYADLPAHAIERARREAAIQLRNDNLVEMLGFIELEETSVTGEVRKHYHVVSELLTGVSLSDVLEGKVKDRDGQDVPYAVEMLGYYRNDPEYFARIVVKNVLSGLMALHDAGYIHRDIDPSNIMLTTDRHIKLIDFGIAKQMNNLTTNDKGLTVAGAFMGKPEYAAPELALGDVKNQNQTTDIYAMGILLYQCLVGHTPFDGARHEILEKQLKAKLPLGVIKNKALRDIIAKACAKRQEQRYQSSAQMRVALETMQTREGGGRPHIPKPLVIAAGGTLAALLLIVGICVAVSNHLSAVRRQETEQLAMIHHEMIQNQIDSLVCIADSAKTVGSDQDMENYENYLITSHRLYAEALEVARVEDMQDLALKVESDLRNVGAQLDAARQSLALQAEDFAGLGETELAQAYAERARHIDTYLSANADIISE